VIAIYPSNGEVLSAIGGAFPTRCTRADIELLAGGGDCLCEMGSGPSRWNFQRLVACEHCRMADYVGPHISRDDDDLVHRASRCSVGYTALDEELRLERMGPAASG
jgi:hypothetical protein